MKLQQNQTESHDCSMSRRRAVGHLARGDGEAVDEDGDAGEQGPGRRGGGGGVGVELRGELAVLRGHVAPEIGERGGGEGAARVLGRGGGRGGGGVVNQIRAGIVVAPRTLLAGGGGRWRGAAAGGGAHGGRKGGNGAGNFRERASRIAARSRLEREGGGGIHFVLVHSAPPIGGETSTCTWSVLFMKWSQKNYYLRNGQFSNLEFQVIV